MPDFFTISKIVPLLFYPLPFILLTVLVLSWWLKKNPVRWFVRGAVILLWVAAMPVSADWLSQWWESPRTIRAELPEVSDVAVVLGGLTDPAVSTPEHLEFNRAAERLTEAVTLYKEGRVKALLITSGTGDLLNQKDKEAPGLAAWARAMGVPKEAVVVESESRNTRENAAFSLPLALARGYRSFVLITSASHMPRSAAIFRKAGYDRDGRTLVLWPVDTQVGAQRFPFSLVPDPSSLSVVQSVLREIAGYGVYAMQGYL